MPFTRRPLNVLPSDHLRAHGSGTALATHGHVTSTEEAMRLLARIAVPLVALPLAMAAAQQPDAGPRPIGLDQAVQLARRNSPVTAQARNSARVANATVKSAIAQFLPNLSLNQGASRSGGATFFQGKLVPYTGDPWSYGKGYSASLELFDGGQRWLDYRAAQAGLQAADQNQTVQRFTVALNVKQQYFAVLAARESEAAAERQLEQANEAMAVTEAKIAGGQLSRADSLHSLVAVGTARLALITARGNIATANAALTRLVGAPFEVTAMAADTAAVPRIALDSAALIQLAVNGPTVQQAAALASASRSSRWAALSPYLPTVYVSYNFGINYTSRDFVLGGGSQSNHNNLSFGVSYSLFNNFQRELGVVQANANADNARVSLDDARLAAREGMVQNLAALRTAEQTIALQALQIAAAQADVEAVDLQYRVGAKALVDVLAAQAALVQARAALIQARLQARTAGAQIEALIGRDLE